MFFQASSPNWGSPQAEFDIAYGNLAQNCGYAMIAQRYAAEYGYDPRAMAKLVVDQRSSGALNPLAAFHGNAGDRGGGAGQQAHRRPYTFTIARQPTAPHFAADVPQLLAVAELTGGIRMTTTLVNVAEADIHVGMKLKARFDQASDEVTLLRFEPAS